MTEEKTAAGKTTAKSTRKKSTARKATAKKTASKKAATKKTPGSRATAQKAVRSTAKATGSKLVNNPAAEKSMSAEERYQRIQQAAYLLAEQDNFAQEPSTYWLDAEKRIS